MGRSGLLALSVVDCIFGVVALSTSGTVSDISLGLNFTLAALLMVLTWQDLRTRGWTWQAPIVGVSYLAAPLVGLVLYALASGRDRREPIAGATA
jgi:hypothetical protein